MYPIALPLSIVLVTWAAADVSLRDLIRPAIIATSVGIVVVLASSGLAADLRLGSISATAFLTALIVDEPLASLAMGLVGVAVILLGRRPRTRDYRFVRPATRLLQAISAIALLTAVVFLAGRPDIGSVIGEAFLAPPGAEGRPSAAVSAPDIYLVLLDGYPGLDAARRAPSFDHDWLPGQLRQRGFDVRPAARTNYLLTRLVLPSMFSGRHLGELAELQPPFGPDHAADARRLRQVTAKAPGLAAFRDAGYDVVWISSGFSHMDIRNVDTWIEAPGPSELEMVMIRETGLGTLLQAIDPNGFARVMRDRITSTFDRAAEVAAAPHDRPRFVFVHVPAPHPPNVFASDGSPAIPGPDTAWDRLDQGALPTSEQRRRTFEHAQAIGRLAVDAIDRIRAASPAEPAIVLFSDHGTDIGFDPTDAMSSDLDERTSVIVAASTPGHPTLLQGSVTPVNIVSDLVSAYTRAEMRSQPDTAFGYRDSVLDLVPLGAPSAAPEAMP